MVTQIQKYTDTLVVSHKKIYTDTDTKYNINLYTHEIQIHGSIQNVIHRNMTAYGRTSVDQIATKSMS